jgi:hypothetical protein
VRSVKFGKLWRIVGFHVLIASARREYDSRIIRLSMCNPRAEGCTVFAHIAAASLALVPCEHHVDFFGWKGGANARYGIVVTTCDGKRHASEVELFDGSNAEDACSATRAVLETFKVPFRAVGNEGFVIESTAKSGIRSIQFVPKGWAPLVTTVPVVPKKK